MCIKVTFIFLCYNLKQHYVLFFLLFLFLFFGPLREAEQAVNTNLTYYLCKVDIVSEFTHPAETK